MPDEPLTTQPDEEEETEGSQLEPLHFEDYDYTPGEYTPFPMSPESLYGPEQLGTQLTAAIDDLFKSAIREESAARIYEVLQRWEARLFDRIYQHVTCDARGWGYGSSNGSPQSVMARGNAMKWFPFNVYGARKDKIVAALSRELPQLAWCAKTPNFAPDMIAADARDKYTEIYLADTNAEALLLEIAGLQYTDDRIALLTESYADKQRWGVESAEPNAQAQQAQGMGQVPETQAQPAMVSEDQPAICEITTAWGVLEHKVSLVADSEDEITYCIFAKEQNCNRMKAKYPWIKDKISAGGGLTTGGDQFDRLARMNVRLGVQNSTVNGESWMRDATEAHGFFKPSEFEIVKDEMLRNMMYDLFPDGLRATRVGTQLAFARNTSFQNHVRILHSRQGTGQNRRAIGTNYLPIQKVLNANMTLVNRYFVGCVPKRYAMEGPINVSAANQQANDPARIIGVDKNQIPSGMTIDNITGIEKVPTPTTGIMEFVEWLATEAPELLDGATPAMFGTEESDTFGQAKLNRDQALQVFGTPWREICWGLAGSAQQAAENAALNRVTDIRAKTPGKNNLSVSLQNMRGNALCYPKSIDLPETVAEQQAKIAEVFEKAAQVPYYASIATDAENWVAIEKYLRMPGVKSKQVESVKKQLGEFELLLKNPPLPNPQFVMAKGEIDQQIQALQPQPGVPVDPEIAQRAQQVSEQLQQALQQIPPLLTSVSVAQNDTEDHATEAATCWNKMNSEDGRKLKNGTQQERQFYQNLELHYQAHKEMQRKLTPVPPLQPKVSVTAAVDKAPPEVQAQAWQALGVEAGPDAFAPDNTLQPHEVTVEKQGVDAQGVPVKQKTSLVGKELQ
jgi:hypothetical protein